MTFNNIGSDHLTTFKVIFGFFFCVLFVFSFCHSHFTPHINSMRHIWSNAGTNHFFLLLLLLSDNNRTIHYSISFRSTTAMTVWHLYCTLFYWSSYRQTERLMLKWMYNKNHSSLLNQIKKFGRCLLQLALKWSEERIEKTHQPIQRERKKRRCDCGSMTKMENIFVFFFFW